MVVIEEQACQDERLAAARARVESGEYEHALDMLVGARESARVSRSVDALDEIRWVARSIWLHAPAESESARRASALADAITRDLHALSAATDAVRLDEIHAPMSAEEAASRAQLARRVKVAAVVLLAALFLAVVVPLIRWGEIGTAFACLVLGAASVAVGWAWPRTGGALLVAISVLLFLPVLSTARWAIAYGGGDESWGTSVLVTLVLLGPIFVTGLVFLLAGSLSARAKVQDLTRP